MFSQWSFLGFKREKRHTRGTRFLFLTRWKDSLSCDRNRFFLTFEISNVLACHWIERGGGGEREREGETDRHTHRERDRQTDRHRHRHRETERARQRQRERGRDRETETETY